MNRMISALLLAFFFSPKLLAFGPLGHRVVAHIAESQLDKITKAKLDEILSGETLPMVSTWADEIRSDKNYAHTFNWHYINIPSGKKVNLKNVEGEAWARLEENLSKLQNKKNKQEQKAQAIKWIVHLVADLHQPLHAGLAQDRGGNKVSLPWFGKESNLHEIWDSKLLLFRELSYTEQADFLRRKITPALRQKASDPIQKWLEEDIALRELIYSYPKPTTSKWEYGYIFRTKDILDEQLIKAGLRLGHLLSAGLQPSK